MSILCVGQLVADMVVRPVNNLPFPGRTDLVEELKLLAGGCAANTAAVLAKLGIESRLATLIGQDSLGDAALADIKTAGVQLDAVLRDSALSTSAVIVVVSSTGQRSFLYREGGNEELSNHHVSDAVLRAARIVHVGGAMKLMKLDLGELMKRGKSCGCTTSLDTDWDPRGNWMRRLEGALPNLDYLLTNQEEAAMLAGEEAPSEAARALLALGPKAVVVKRGEHGALLATSAGVSEFPTYPVAVRDTTCAGDSFVAGFLLGVHQGWPLEEAMCLANAAGALCTTQVSHRAITSLEDTRRLIQSHRNDRSRTNAGGVGASKA
jgi:sugar/nucleoside kinase (ribokinase family)